MTHKKADLAIKFVIGLIFLVLIILLAYSYSKDTLNLSEIFFRFFDKLS